MNEAERTGEALSAEIDHEHIQEEWLKFLNSKEDRNSGIKDKTLK